VPASGLARHCDGLGKDMVFKYNYEKKKGLFLNVPCYEDISVFAST
jgi:hypothetical protein